jgi:hypothetical protein
LKQFKCLTFIIKADGWMLPSQSCSVISSLNISTGYIIPLPGMDAPAIRDAIREGECRNSHRDNAFPHHPVWALVQ